SRHQVEDRSMRWVKSMVLTLWVLGLAWISPAPEPVAARQAVPKFEDVVKIEFPNDGYTYTLAEAAKGVKIQYKIVVAQDYPGVIALRDGPSFHEPPGPSGLFPREQISGNDQLYCLWISAGARPRRKLPPRSRKAATFTRSSGTGATGPARPTL